MKSCTTYIVNGLYYPTQLNVCEACNLHRGTLKAAIHRAGGSKNAMTIELQGHTITINVTTYPINPK